MDEVVFKNRSLLTPEESLKQLYQSAYKSIQDAKQRSHVLRLSRVHAVTFGLIASAGLIYVGYNCIEGVWARLSTTNQVTNLIRIAQNPVRAVYRPEIYLRDQNATEIIKQRSDPQHNPLRLWH